MNIKKLIKTIILAILNTILVAIIVSILVSLFNAYNKIPLKDVNFNAVNYNNRQYYQSFSANGTTAFYGSDGFDNMRIFAYHKGIKSKLTEANVFLPQEEFSSTFQVINNYGYFRTASKSEEQYHIYQYSLAERTYQKIFSTEEISRWMVTPNHIVYCNFKDKNQLRNLHIYSFDTQTEMLVREGILEYGITSNKLRYIMPSDTETVTIFEFDLDTKEERKWGEFVIPYQDQYLTYNFTTDYTMFCDENDSKHFTVCAENGTVSEYQLPMTIAHFVAGDKYAFAVCYETPRDSTTRIRHKDNGIYRIDLSTGDYEKIRNISGECARIYVLSDEQIYIITGRTHYLMFMMYKETVYSLDVEKQKAKRLFMY